MDSVRGRPREKINVVSLHKGLSFFLERGRFFLNVFVGEDRWGFRVSLQVHHHLGNFDKCATVHFGRFDGEFLRLLTAD